MMKTVKPLLVVSILTGLCFIVAGCDDKTATEAAKISYQTWPLSVAQVTTETLPQNYTTTGSVVSDQRIKVASRTTGFIREILVREGELITKGEPLVLLDDADIEGAIEQAQAAVNRSSATQKDAQTDLDRFEKLFKLGSISGEKLRKTRLQRDVAKDTQEETEAALKTSLAQRQYVRITSPISGVVVVRHRRDGDLASPGVPILTVESNSGFLFETYVSENRLKKIKQHDSVQVNIDALDNPLTGIVARVVPSADPLTRKFLVKVTLPEQAGLLPGMFGRSHFQIGTEPAIVISHDALTQRGGLQGVFVVNNQNHAYFRWLRIGKEIGDRVEILAGLRNGERIVSTPNPRLHEGDLIIAPGDATNE